MVIQKEDEEGKLGVKIGRELMNVAAMALKRNITSLGPLVLPVSEQLIFAGNYVARKVCTGGSSTPDGHHGIPPQIALTHVCCPVGTLRPRACHCLKGKQDSRREGFLTRTGQMQWRFVCAGIA